MPYPRGTFSRRTAGRALDDRRPIPALARRLHRRRLHSGERSARLVSRSPARRQRRTVSSVVKPARTAAVAAAAAGANT